MSPNKYCTICGELLNDEEVSFLENFFEEDDLEYSHEHCYFRDKHNNLLCDLDFLREAYGISEYINIFCAICSGILTSYDSIEELFSGSLSDIDFCHVDCVIEEEKRQDVSFNSEENEISIRTGKTSYLTPEKTGKTNIIDESLK